ncbi:MAG: nucleotidyl transferase family protein [Desulfuromonadales bacterium]
MINRAAVLLKCKAPMVQWINTSDPCNDNPQISQEEANRDRTVYLISDHDAYDDKALARWIKGNYAALFESELEGWYTDESLWPQPRSLKLFHEWFEVECHSLIEDTVGGPIEDDDL